MMWQEDIKRELKTWLEAFLYLAIIASVVMGIFLATGLLSAARGDQMIEETLPIIAMAESSNRPWVVSKDGGYGLYQITTPCLKHFNKINKTNFVLDDMLNPVLCKRVATWYLEYLKGTLGIHYNQQTLILAYNWGIGNVKKHSYKIPNWAKNHPNKIYRKILGGC